MDCFFLIAPIIFLHAQLLVATSTSSITSIQDAVTQEPKESFSGNGIPGISIQSHEVPPFQFLPPAMSLAESHFVFSQKKSPRSVPKTLNLFRDPAADKIDESRKRKSVSTTDDKLEVVQLCQPASKKPLLDLNLHLGQLELPQKEIAGWLASLRSQLQPGIFAEQQHPIYTTSSEVNMVSSPDSQRRGRHHLGIESDASPHALQVGASFHKNSQASNSRSPTLRNTDSSFSVDDGHQVPSTGAQKARSLLQRDQLTKGNRREHLGNLFDAESMNPAIWAWITIVRRRVDEFIGTEVANHVEPLTNKLTSSCIANNHDTTSQVHGMRVSSMNGVKLKDKVKEFATSLWAMNLRVLEVLMAPQSSSIYLEEQKNAMQWFVDFMAGCKEREEELEGEELFVYQKIVEAVHCDEEQYIYKVYRKRLTGTTIFVSQSQFLNNKSVIHFLSFYYRKTNGLKWKQLFQDETTFLLKIADFGQWWGGRNLGTSWAFDMENVAGLTPWKTSLGPEFSLQSGLIKHQGLGFRFAKFVTRFDPKEGERFVIEDVEEMQWAWISIIKTHSKDINVQLPTPNFEVIDNLRSFTEDALAKKLGEEKKVQFLLAHSYNVGSRLELLLLHLWAVNSEILQCLGCQIPGKHYFEEQELIRSFFEFQYSQGKKSRSNGDMLQQNQNFHKNYQITELDDLMMELILLQDDSIIYKAKHSNDPHASFSLVSKSHLIISKIVVHIIGYYYKTQNYAKWSVLFGTDDKMFEFIIRVGSVGFFRGKTFLDKDRPALKNNSLSLIPWRMKLEDTVGNTAAKVQKVLQYKSKASIDKWVEKTKTQ
ncbi:hypothetical protein Pst134EA_007534 [Puccinia striiformis f. sp. tritici]|uniref:hypothetical protein n=1 Tax=Puccinia striiformis f. sp. tritici TaxID=168172 RepID=UPI0020074D77|nr:hypothetical protein Pst134EA_007534 [Puccinia striiformis f. sp. tritici]KAH9470270.1 hypothetical protein Pst134EA_007534 [Puccinia striiformis f. sp. tritici]